MLKAFLKRQAKTPDEKIFNIVVAFTLVLLGTAITMTLYSYLFKTTDGVWEDQFYFPKKYSNPWVQNFFFMCISAPLIEEFLFRKFPMNILLSLSKKRREEFIVPVILFTSIIFGWLHGSVEHVWIQGWFGFVAACLYVKNGYSYMSSVTLHFLWNFCILEQMIKF